MQINKLVPHSVVDFAAEELKKYIRMMMPEGGDVKIAFNPTAADGFRLGLMQDFGLDVSDAEDPELDDIIDIDCNETGGVIAGSNPRSVLLAVYEYLRQNGCRWLFPGVDGEYIPIKNTEPVKYRHKASLRYRGWCNEGAEYQQSMLELINFTPKVGLNVCMMEFRIPPYYNKYYSHSFNDENYSPESISDATILQWKRQCEAEIAKRGLQFHDIGHGFTIDPFGIDSSAPVGSVDESKIPAETLEMLAMVDGRRGLTNGNPVNTNFCMSNPKARRMVVNYVADYSASHSNIDYLHVWLADGTNRHCECEECRKKIPSDWYIMLMNEIDEELSARGLKTRIVFIVYVDTTWPPIDERIKNPNRFSILFAPISRSYMSTLPAQPTPFEPKPFVLNRMTFPGSLEEYLGYFAEWRKFWHGGAFAYEYHFWWHQCSDLSGIHLAERINEDVKAYEQHRVLGIVEDGSQRSFFPTGLAFYTYARTLFDSMRTPYDLAEEYMSAAFGEDWKSFYDYLLRIADTFGHGYMEGKGSSDPEIGQYYNPEVAQRLSDISKIIDEGRKLIDSHYNSDFRVRTVSVRLLEYHLELCHGLAKVFSLKSMGDDEGAAREIDLLRKSFGRHEAKLRLYFDHHLYFRRYVTLINSSKSKVKDITQID